MCFIRTVETPQPVETDVVQRKQADASITKNSKKEQAGSIFYQNLKTSNSGIDDYSNTNRKTLLGE